MKKIIFLNENRSSGLGRANEELWESWLFLNDGEFIEDDENFQMKSTRGEEFVANKNNELSAAKVYNRYLQTDLKIFEVFEGTNPSGGYFILYRFRDSERRNEFIISTLMGIAEGSSINFKIT